jgi:hypothetical protein
MSAIHKIGAGVPWECRALMPSRPQTPEQGLTQRRGDAEREKKKGFSVAFFSLCGSV